MDKQKKMKDEFKLAIFKSKLSKGELALKMKISQGYMSNMFSDRYVLTEPHYRSLNKILKTKIEYVKG